MTWQEGKEEKSAAFFNGVLYILTKKKIKNSNNSLLRTAFNLIKMNKRVTKEAKEQQKGRLVLTSMSDSDWQGPLNSRSTEGHARSWGRSTAQLLANTAGSSVRMPGTQSQPGKIKHRHSQKLKQKAEKGLHKINISRKYFKTLSWCLVQPSKHELEIYYIKNLAEIFVRL